MHARTHGIMCILTGGAILLLLLFAFQHFWLCVTLRRYHRVWPRVSNRGPEVRNFACDVCVFFGICCGMDARFKMVSEACDGADDAMLMPGL